MYAWPCANTPDTPANKSNSRSRVFFSFSQSVYFSRFWFKLQQSQTLSLVRHQKHTYLSHYDSLTATFFSMLCLKALLCVRTAGRHVPLSEHFVILAYVRRRVSKFTWNGNTEVPRSPLCWFPVTPGLRLATFLATEVLMKFTKDRGRLNANVTKAR